MVAVAFGVVDAFRNGEASPKLRDAFAVSGRLCEEPIRKERRCYKCVMHSFGRFLRDDFYVRLKGNVNAF